MPWYRYEDLRALLIVRGCHTEGDVSQPVSGWFRSDWTPFTLPLPVDGWVDADVVDVILADRWIAVGPIPLRRHFD